MTYDGVADLIKDIYRSGIELMIATFKPKEQAQFILKRMGLDSLFSYYACGLEDSISSKSSIVLDAIKHSRNKPAQCIYIGDTAGDEKAALDNGIDFIGVKYGFGSEGFSDFTETVSTVEELRRFLFNSI